ncbi:hypothetical protein GUITHDRAFT_148209 [Guillardia theta CCMP2712]|uniref:Uncharacterized protein n=1 Tax=Guillardia theta (strain CCMP2712) TaxID=905079 RepID=L1IAB3_GUITC|nr:hypothetical protein GUITHDRAFT_148209 [Guillardia theta CCMP2712]EKX33052.1 hypothetical protein GUITHDRAFT_148209 [Guillardia theta CCMP2712]|eukprot:XP_005820032.1 hypothetical protein GUITHDRAFT_148209 [Guillardia theta CCMP2712]
MFLVVISWKDGRRFIWKQGASVNVSLCARGRWKFELIYTFHGCLHYTCSSGVSNVGPSLRPKTNPKFGKYLGSFPEVWSCEHACMADGRPVSIKVSRRAASAGATRLWLTALILNPQKDIAMETLLLCGIQLSTTSVCRNETRTLFKSSTRPGIKLGEFLLNLRDSVKAWPIIVGCYIVRNDGKYFTASNVWAFLSLLAVSWPLVFLFVKKEHGETSDTNGARIKLGSQLNAKQNKGRVMELEKFFRFDWVDAAKKTK